jgi:hypothetical protein
MTARLVEINQVKADSNHVFELRVYHTVPGKVPELESRFRDTTSKILVKHDLVANSSREEAKKNWDAFRADPEFQEVLKAEQANKTVGKIDETYMRPTDFSPMK